MESKTNVSRVKYIRFPEKLINEIEDYVENSSFNNFSEFVIYASRYYLDQKKKE